MASDAFSGRLAAKPHMVTPEMPEWQQKKGVDGTPTNFIKNISCSQAWSGWTKRARQIDFAITLSYQLLSLRWIELPDKNIMGAAVMKLVRRICFIHWIWNIYVEQLDYGEDQDQT